MKYISAEQFLKADKKIQENLLDWCELEIGDLIHVKDAKYNTSIINSFEIMENEEFGMVFEIYDKKSNGVYGVIKEDIIPLLTEGQLRKFIEDTLDCKIEIEVSHDIGYKGYDVFLRKEGEYPFKNFENLSENLLQVYWQIACEVAKNNVKEV